MIEFNCDSCQATIKVAEAAAGKRGKCNKCGAILLVPPAPQPLPQQLVQPIATSRRVSLSVLLVACVGSLFMGAVIGAGIGTLFKSDPVVPTPSDPVAEFQKHVAGELEQVRSAKQPNTTVGVEEDWSYNVQKTDSLVSPLMGTCDVIFHVEAAPLPGMTLRYDVKAKMACAFQQGKWVTKSVSGEFDNVSAKPATDEPMLVIRCEYINEQMEGERWAGEQLSDLWGDSLFHTMSHSKNDRPLQ